MASGCLGLVSFPREPGRVTLERLAELHPGLLARPARPSRASASCVVRSEEHGAVALGARRRSTTSTRSASRARTRSRRSARTPRAHVRRTDGFPHCPDVLVNAAYSPDTEEVAAFEELVGSHGGMGGSQSFPFVLFPTRARLPRRARWSAPSTCTGCMRRWLVELGHDAYRDEAHVTVAGDEGSPPASR